MSDGESATAGDKGSEPDSSSNCTCFWLEVGGRKTRSSLEVIFVWHAVPDTSCYEGEDTS